MAVLFVATWYTYKWIVKWMDGPSEPAVEDDEMEEPPPPAEPQVIEQHSEEPRVIVVLPKILIVEKPTLMVPAVEPPKPPPPPLPPPTQQEPTVVKKRKRRVFFKSTETAKRERAVCAFESELDESVRTVLKTLGIRDREVYHCLRECDGCQAKELAVKMNMATITIRAHLSTLISHRLVVKAGSKKSGKYVAVNNISV